MAYKEQGMREKRGSVCEDEAGFSPDLRTPLSAARDEEEGERGEQEKADAEAFAEPERRVEEDSGLRGGGSVEKLGVGDLWWLSG